MATDDYWMNLLGQTQAEKAAAGAAGGGGMLKGLKGGGLKGIGSSILGYMILSRLLNIPGEIGERNVQREAIQSQASMATPENLYYQAAMPQAQQEEEMARQALFSQISGGVLGPSLATGERLIGG